MIRVTLTDDQLDYADDVARRRNSAPHIVDQLVGRDGLEAHRIGARGEMGFGVHVGSEALQVYERGVDPGYDFRLGDRLVDVKSRTYDGRRAIAAYDLMIPAKHKIHMRADLVLAVVNGRDVYLTGWLPALEFVRDALAMIDRAGRRWRYVPTRGLYRVEIFDGAKLSP